jgi:hypothetical protein
MAPGRPFTSETSKGRPKGAKNKVTRAAKAFLADLCSDPEVQAAVKARIIDGDTLGFFKAVEMVHGKPKQATDVTLRTEAYVTPNRDDIEDTAEAAEPDDAGD